MGKRKSRGRASSEHTPRHSDNSSDEGPSPKRGNKRDSGGTSSRHDRHDKQDKKLKSSAEICEDLGFEDVELEFTDADYQNLTTYSLFSRMVRPQLLSANPKSTSGKMAQVLEVKWREYGKAKVAADHRRKAAEKEALEDKERAEAKKKAEEDHKKQKEEKKKRAEEERQRKEKEERKRKEEEEERKIKEEEEERKIKEEEEDVEEDEEDEVEEEASKSKDDEEFAEIPDEEEDKEEEQEEEDEKDEDVEEEKDEEEDKDEEEEEESEEEDRRRSKGHSKRTVAPLRIKMPMIALRKSKRERKPVKGYVDDSDSTQSGDRRAKKKRRSAQLDSDSESDGRSRRRRSGQQKKVQYSDEESDGSGVSKRRRRSKKTTPKAKPVRRKKKQESDDDDAMNSDEKTEEDGDVDVDSQDLEESSSSSEGDSDDSDDSLTRQKRKKRRRKKMKKNEKPRIPGERKSDRSHGNTSTKLMSDDEFEDLMEEEELNKEKEKRKQEKLRAEKIKKQKRLERLKEREAERTKKGDWQNKNNKDKSKEEKEEREPKEKDDGNESDHYWFCEMCKDGGDLLLCDTCPKSFHKECLKLDDVPEGDWSCPICTGEGLPEEGDSDEFDHEESCRVCKDGGDVILCDYCPCVFHMHCLNPSLKVVPEGDWMCPRCVMGQDPPKARIMKVLTWRWSHQMKGSDELDHTHSPKKKAPAVIDLDEDSNSNDKKTDDKSEEKEPKGLPTRELFVRYEYHSYWDCEWIPELQLEVHQSQTWHAFRNRFDLDEPPALEDGSTYGKMRHKEDIDKDPFKLESTYYRYGIKPEWLAIKRIIAHEGKGRDTKYLVQWRDLAYNDCTWEYPGEVQKGLDEEFRQRIDTYWERRKERINDKDLKKIAAKPPKKSALKKKMEKQPSYITCGGNLHPYQLEGLNWMRFSYSQDTNVILADEMGLGKTIQTIVFLHSLWKEGYSPGPFLISAPLSTVANWEREFEFWAPEMYVVTYSGARDARMVIRERDFCYKDGAFAMLAKPSKLRAGFRPKFDVLLTSYEFVNIDMATLASIDWAVVTIDEAHRLKNNQSLFFTTLTSYKIGFKLLLTGTPLQNNLEELFNLLNFLEPGKFHSQDDFLMEFDNVDKELQVKRLHEMLAPHMLRRLKSDVLKDIPDKTELIVRVELAPLQKKLYKLILTKNFEALNVKGHAATTSLMNIMMDLRKCCNHAYMFPTAEADAPITRDGKYEGIALIKACGKLILLEKMLIKLKRDGHRVLIFSQMTRCLNILEEFLEHLNIGFERIDGGISGRNRQESIDRFNSPDSDKFVFLLSTKAGGLGINLATADTVIIYDMDWNPHNDIQAFSRAHRIGQKNKVMIYRFVSRNTVEERMAQVCKKKMMLTELVIHKGLNAQGEKKDSLSKQEVNDILKYGAEDLFKDKDGESKAVVYDDDAVEKLLDREQEGEKEDAEVPDKQLGIGMNDYLRSFRVASYQVKEGEEVEAVVEEEEPGPSTSAEPPQRPDKVYWEKVLGSSYQEYAEERIREEEAIARTLGKGKRVRKRINYAEQQALIDREESERRKQRVVEDATYLSDYEPTSSSGSDEEEGDGEGDDPDAEITETKETKGKGKTLSRREQQQKQQELEQQQKERELPPLLAKVNNQVEVLGYTARQRRAFLDTVMKFGMPPDDAYNSQWRGRDLLQKPERVFKAYVSLFMRHLCEPIADDAECFSDGIPREGLSRQHVLTRIGMIALIRKKVSEFEANNGWDSMARFTVGPRPVSGFRKGQLAQPRTDSPVKDASASLKAMLTGSQEKDVKSVLAKSENEGSNETTEKDDSSKPDESSKSTENKESTKTDESSKSAEKDEPSKSDDLSKSTDKEESTKTDKSSNSTVKEESTKDEEMDKTGDEPETTKNDSKKDDSSSIAEKMDSETVERDSSKVDEQKDSSTSEIERSKKSQDGDGKETDAKSVAQSNKNTDVEIKEEMNKSKADDEQVIGDKEKENDNKNTEIKIEGEGAMETKDNSEDKMDVDEEKSNDKSKENSGDAMETDKKEIDKIDEKPTESKMDETDKTEEVKDDESKKVVEDQKESNKSDETEKKSGDSESGTDKSGAKEKTGSEKIAKDSEVITVDDSQEQDKENKEGAKKEEKKGPKSYSDLAQELRRIFWIADGGFTELHAFWQLEETTMKESVEYRTWHRRHDFWLLVGVITHGYRHWQDILNDPRFEILCHAFRTDDLRMKKAAFLNRRFQVLEQALVIEEQLRKAVKRNQGIPAVQEALKRSDNLTAQDKMASHLRKVNQAQSKGKVDKKSVKALNQVGCLVQDIKQNNYSSLPGTLIQAPPPATPVAPVRKGPPHSVGQKVRNLIDAKKVGAMAQTAMRGQGSGQANAIAQSMLRGQGPAGQQLNKFVSHMLSKKKEGKKSGSDVICLD